MPRGALPFTRSLLTKAAAHDRGRMPNHGGILISSKTFMSFLKSWALLLHPIWDPIGERRTRLGVSWRGVSSGCSPHAARALGEVTLALEGPAAARRGRGDLQARRPTEPAWRGLRKPTRPLWEVGGSFTSPRGYERCEQSPATYHTRTSTLGRMWMERSHRSRGTGTRSRYIVWFLTSENHKAPTEAEQDCHTGRRASPRAPGTPSGSQLCCGRASEAGRSHRPQAPASSPCGHA